MTSAAKVRGKVRTQWLALGAALVVLAGVLVAWALSRAADRVQVVAVAQPIRAGDVIDLEDLTVTGIAFDGTVTGLVPDTSLEALVGKVAAVDLDAGALVQVGMWRDGAEVGPGERTIGAVLAAGQFPVGLGQGDAAMAAPLDPENTTAPVVVRVLAAVPTDDGSLGLTLAVPEEHAVALAQLAANDLLVLVGLGMAEAPPAPENPEATQPTAGGSP